MEAALSLLVGLLFAAGFYMMLRRDLVKLSIGLALIGHAANLLLFTSAGLTRATAPVIAEGARVPPVPHADPLPQALILTAIVIGFGVLAFALALIERTVAVVGTADVAELREQDP